MISSKLPKNLIKSISSPKKSKTDKQTNIISESTSEKSCRSVSGGVKTDNTGCDDKPSLIPRRTSTSKKPTKEALPSQSINNDIPTTQKPLIEPNTVRRVEFLEIGSEFCPELPKAVTTTRPIPTLGQIYRSDVSNDAMTVPDWYLEADEYLNTPQESNGSHNTADVIVGNNCTALADIDCSLNDTSNLIFKSINNTTNSGVMHNIIPLKVFKTTNENVSEWITYGMNNSNNDKELGYRSISTSMKIRASNKINKSSLTIPDEENNFNVFNNTLKRSVSTTAIKSEPEFILEKEATVIISKGNPNSDTIHQHFKVPKVNTDIKALINSKSDMHKPLKYPSTPTPYKKREDIKIPVASYVEYPSEVLQRTTNFESEAFATSSGIARNLNIYDTKPSQWTVDYVDEYNGNTEEAVWSRLQSPQESCIVEFSKTSNVTEESWKINNFEGKNERHRTSPDKCSYRDYHKHYCWRKEVAKKDIDEQCPWDYKGRCKMCEKCRKNHRKKLRRPFQILNNHSRVGRNCKFGWSRVWKKTTERWTHWSKSTSIFGNLRMHNLRKYLNWDHADAPTVLVYRETGTDTVANVQKSAEIAASQKQKPWAAFCTNDSSSSAKYKSSQIKHVNIGPSMFPFLYYPSTLLVAKSPTASHLQSQDSIRSQRNFSSFKIKDAVKLKSSINSRLGNESTGEIPSSNTKTTSLPHYVLENGTVTENATTPMENKITSTTIKFSHIKLVNTDSQDAYTQIFVNCNNAATDVKNTPNINSNSNVSTKSIDEAFYNGVDKGTEPIPPFNKSQRSLSIMTSQGNIQDVIDNETQIPPDLYQSKRKNSTASPEKHHMDSNASVVTDTTVPCRRIENMLITPKGTILTCTGTKVTSMSSEHIPTSSVNVVTAECLTSPSLCRNHLEDVMLSTHTLQVVKNEKSTSCAVKTFVHAGVSASNVADRVSCSGGSHHSLKSFCAATLSDAVTLKCQDCVTSPSLQRSHLQDVSLGEYGFQSVRSEKSTSCAPVKSVTDAEISASNLVNRASYCGGSHQTMKSFSTAINPECSSACVNTAVEMKSDPTSASHSLGKTSKKIKRVNTRNCQVQYSEHFKESSNGSSTTSTVNSRNSNSKYLANIGHSRLLSVRMLSGSVTDTATQAQPEFLCAETNTASKQKTSTSALTSRFAFGEPLLSKLKLHPTYTGNISTSKSHVDSKTIDADETRSQSLAAAHDDAACKSGALNPFLVLTAEKDPSEQRDSNTESNSVISSNLNATKWLEGCIENSAKDIQSIISIGETMVSESLDRASLVIAGSKDGHSVIEMKKLSKVLINHEPAVSCVTGTGYRPSSSFVCKLPPLKKKKSIPKEPSDNPNENVVVIVNNMSSDENTAQIMGQPLLKQLANIRDTGIGSVEKMLKQQSASVLTSRHILASPPRCLHTLKDVCKDCVFVYDRPRCVVHSFLADAVVQTELQYRKPESLHKYINPSNHSVGLATSFGRYSRQKSSIVGEVLSPKVYKALYETTQLIAREASVTVPEMSCNVPAPSQKAENADAAEATRSNGYGQMTLCMLSAPDQCCCTRCLDADNMNTQSIQTLTQVLQCPNCNARITNSFRAVKESAQDGMESVLLASCRYYSNLLNLKLGQVKKNLKKHIAPPTGEACYHAATVPNDMFQRPLASNNNIIFTEACTMKPSGKHDENCQAHVYQKKLNEHSCILLPALSLTDVRGDDKNNLHNVYCILTAIEGRVRRLKNNLTC